MLYHTSEYFQNNSSKKIKFIVKKNFILIFFQYIKQQKFFNIFNYKFVTVKHKVRTTELISE